MTREVPIDPFAPTDAVPPLRTGDLDIGRAVADALAAVFRNLLPLIGAVAIAVIAYLLSICTCVGWIVGLPLMMWGLYRFLLDMLDGRSEVSAMWSGFDRFGPAFSRMWGLTALYIVVALPLAAVLVALALFTGGIAGLGLDGDTEPMHPAVYSALSMIPTTLYGFLLVRFVFAPFLIVERGMGALDAFRESWASSGPVWGRLVALQLLLTLLNLPAQALGVGMQMLTRSNPTAAIDNVGLTMGLAVGMYALLAVAGTIGMAIMTAAYRQVFGKPA